MQLITASRYDLKTSIYVYEVIKGEYTIHMFMCDRPTIETNMEFYSISVITQCMNKKY